MSFWRTASGAEVDLVLGDAEVAIEIKSSEKAGVRTKGLHLFREENTCRETYVISRDPLPREMAPNVTILPWQIFCEMLWQGKII